MIPDNFTRMSGALPSINVLAENWPGTLLSPAGQLDLFTWWLSVPKRAKVEAFCSSEQMTKAAQLQRKRKYSTPLDERSSVHAQC